jgi:hypothetical protein
MEHARAMRVGLVQLATEVGNLAGNARAIRAGFSTLSNGYSWLPRGTTSPVVAFR